MPLYVDYSPDNRYMHEMELPIFPFRKKVNYEIEQILDKNISKTGKYIIKFNGKRIDKRKGEEIKSSAAFSKRKNIPDTEDNEELEFIYKLDYKTNLIFSITGCITLNISKNSVRKIQMEIYEKKIN